MSRLQAGPAAHGPKSARLRWTAIVGCNVHGPSIYGITVKIFSCTDGQMDARYIQYRPGGPSSVVIFDKPALMTRL